MDSKARVIEAIDRGFALGIPGNLLVVPTPFDQGSTFMATRGVMVFLGNCTIQPIDWCSIVSTLEIDPFRVPAPGFQNRNLILILGIEMSLYTTMIEAENRFFTFATLTISQF